MAAALSASRAGAVQILRLGRLLIAGLDPLPDLGEDLACDQAARHAAWRSRGACTGPSIARSWPPRSRQAALKPRRRIERVLVFSQVRFTYAEAMTDPKYYIPLAKAAEEAGYHAMTIADSIAYPFESDSKYPVHPRRQPRVPGRQGVHRVVRPRRRAVRGDHDAALQLLRAEAADPPARAGGQAGRLAGGAVRQPPRPRRRHQPVAGGLRTDGRAVRQARQADGRVHRHHQRPDIRRLLRVPRRVLRHPEDQDDARADQAGPDPDRRPRRRRVAPRGPQRRLDARRRRPARNSTG